MTKTMKIQGMSCNNCKNHVEKALNSLPGVKAEVDLEQQTAHIEIAGSVSDEALKAAVTEAGYEVAGLE